MISKNTKSCFFLLSVIIKLARTKSIPGELAA